MRAIPTMPPEMWADLVGSKFVAGGRDPGTGLNCWGLVLEIYRRAGRELHDPAAGVEDSVALAGGVPAAELAARWLRVPEGAELPGDVVAYATKGDGMVDHVGVILGGGRVLMASAGVGVVSVPYPATMRAAFAGVWRPRDHARDQSAAAIGDRSSGAISVRLVPHLFDRSTWQEYAQPVGATLAELIPEQYAESPACHVALNGARVDRARWHEVRPEAGDHVVACATPEAEAAALAILGLEGVALTAAQTAAVFALTAIFTGIISFGLSFLAMKLLAPAQPDQDTGPVDRSPTYSQLGIRNSIGSGHTAPIVFGRHRVGGVILGTYNSISSLIFTPSLTGSVFFGPEDLISSDIPSQAFASGGKTTLNMAFLLSEGECESVLDMPAGSDFSSVSSSAIPANALLINGNDGRGFRDVRVSARMGRATQDALPNFSRTINAVGYETELRQNITFVHTTTQQVDGFELQMFLAQGLYIVDDDGGLKRKIIDWQFRYRIKGQTNFIETVNVRWRYKNRAPHSNKWGRFNLPRNYYEIQCTRLTGNDDDPAVLADDDQHVSQVYMNAVNEVRDTSFSWPGWCVVAVEALASEQLSGQPSFTFLMKGKKWWVWDGVSQTLPAWSKLYTTNPADCTVGFLLNKLFGFGEFVAVEEIDFAALAVARAYCDEMIDDGRGGTMKRWELGLVIDTAEKGDDILKKLLATFRASMPPAGNKFSLRIDKAETPSALLGEGSLKSFKIGYIETNDRPTRVSVSFANEEIDYEIDTVTVEVDDIASREYIEETVTLLGITKPARAMRAAQHRLNVAQRVDRVITADGAIDALTVGAGDVAYFAHQQLSTQMWSGRVIAATSGGSPTVTLDQDLTLPTYGPGWRVRVRTRATGSFVYQERTIGGAFPASYVAGTPVPVTADWNVGDVPQRDDAYAAGKSDSYVDAYRIVASPLRDDVTRAIEAMNYDASVYDDDPGTVPTATDRLHDPRKFPAALLGVTVGEETRVLPSGEVDECVVVSWAPADDFDKVDVFMRDVDFDEADAWTYCGRSDGNRYEIRSLVFGHLYEMSAVPVSSGGSRRMPDAGTLRCVFVAGRLKAPPDPTNFRVSQHYGDVVLSWASPADPGRDIRGWEIRATSNADAYGWVFGVPVAFVAYPQTTVRLPIIVPRGSTIVPRYMIRAVSRNGVASLGMATADAGVMTSYVREVQTNAQAGSWAGTKTGMATSGAELHGSAGSTSIAYETPALDLAETKRVELADMLHVTVGDRTALTWDAAVFPWDSAGARVRDWTGNPFTDYPDTFKDAVRCTWDMAGFSWDNAIAKGRTWSGLAPSFFALTHQYKGADTTGALTAATFQTFMAQVVEWRYHALKVGFTIPDDAYIVKAKKMTPGFYHRPEFITGTVRTDAGAPVTVTFPAGTFKETPTVVCVFAADVVTGAGYHLDVSSVSAAGFDVTAYDGAGMISENVDYIVCLI